MNKLTNIEFIKRSSLKHKYSYDYSLIEYKRVDVKVNIICPNHGIFAQKPRDHMRGQGCPKCAIIASQSKLKLSTEEFIRRANKKHDNKYDYSLTDYKTLKEYVNVICPIHGIFSQRADVHLKGNGCQICYLQKRGELDRLSQNEFINKANIIHNNKYDYSSTRYITMENYIDVICLKHGKFKQQAQSHLNGRGCPICSESNGEKIIRRFLTEDNIKFIPQYRFKNCKRIRPLPFDFYLPDYNTCIEFNGEQHYNPVKIFGIDSFNSTVETDLIKQKYCLDNGIKLITIKYDENLNESLKKLFLINEISN